MYLIPKPKKIKGKEGQFSFSYDMRIVLDPAIGAGGMVYASALLACMEQWAGYRPAITKGKPEAGGVYLALNSQLSGQEYLLKINKEEIIIEGGEEAGIWYGVQTLCQIIEQQGALLEAVEIQDFPDVCHRGYYLDQTRGRVLKLDALKRVVDRLCRYKYNELQLYVEHTYLFSGLSEMWRKETPLTAEDILELDTYCRERHVELIPSLSSFGHLYTLLSTKSYGELCELEGSWQQPFSFLDRMRHHTVNVTDERVLPLIKGMLEEYLNLFSSDKFNLCADETFDLGKGKAKQLAEEKGVHRIYIDYVKELCQFLVEKGKTPMFWGDVISEQPELIKELPENVICLTWGYAPDQTEDESRKMAELGARQYLCPGVQGWNHWINQVEDSYQNIVRMCSYARKYHALGVMTTDWGDYGHVNDPAYSVPGMIYGGAFSWNGEVLCFEEINRQIAKVEYHDQSEQLVNLVAEMSKCAAFDWFDAVIYYEKAVHGEKEVDLTDRAKGLDQAVAESLNRKLLEIGTKMKETASSMDSSSRKLLQAYDRTIQGLCIWNEIGALLMKPTDSQEQVNGQEQLDGEKLQAEREELAARLEAWFMSYKGFWRQTSREGDLHHVAEIIFWYADLLRKKHAGMKGH